jgi:hypothetical protein
MDEHMAGDSVSRIAAGDAARAVLTMLLALVAFVVGPPAIATASPPTLAIEQPVTGSLTNNQLPMFSGSSEDEAEAVTVKVYEGPSAEGLPVAILTTTSPLPEGKWAVADEAPLEPGVYTAVAEQEFEGVPTASEPVTFTIDTTAPAVSIDPVASPTNNPTPTLTGTLGTEPGDSATVAVTVHEGASAGGQVVSTGPATVEGSTWSYTPSLPDGVYTAQATQPDEAGNTGTSTTTTFTVDTQAPNVSIASVVSPTNDATPTLTGGDGTEAGDGTVTVTIYAGLTTENEVVSGSATTEGSAWTYTPTKLPDGTYTARAIQHDEAGNTAVSTPVTFTIDTTSPSASIDAVTSPTNDATPTLTGKAGTETGDGSVTVTVYEGPAPEGKVASTGKATSEGSAWTYTPTKLPDGTYTVRAIQHDEAGNTGASVAVTFTVDATAPQPTITAPTEGAVLNTSRVTLSGTASQSSGDLKPITLKVYAGASTAGSPVQTLEVTASAGKWTTGAGGPVLADHLYTVLAEQSDQAGNVGTDTVTFTIKTSSPTVTLDTSTFVHRASTLVTDATPNFSGSGSTAPEDSLTILLKIYKGGSTSGSPVREIESTLSGSKWQTGPVATLADGVYTAVAEQEDTNPFGQTGVSTSSTFTVDGHAPAVTLTTPANSSTTTRSSQPLAGAAGTAAGDSATITVQLYVGSSATGTPLQAVTVQATAGAWTAAAGGLEPGTYTARAEQADDVGNLGLSTPATFTVTTSSPTVTLATGTFVHRANTLYSSATPSFNGTGSTRPEDSNTIHVKVISGESSSGSPVGEIVATLSGTKWQTSPVAALTDGTYTAVAEQSTSNSSPPGVSTPVTFTVDAVAPSVTLTTPANAGTTTSSSEPLAGAAGTAAGDSATITVKLYAGSSATGSPLQTVSVQASAGAWSATAGGLEPGTYTARAEQSDDVGNIGPSAPATFSVTKPEPPPVTPPVTTPVAPPAPVVIPPVVSGPTLLQPFPVVRIAGSVTASGVKLNLLTVQAPVGTLVSISCHGHGCPTRNRDTVSATGRSKSKSGLVMITFRRFERALGAGATLQIKVYGPGQIGKYTRFTIRRGKLPLRLDTCLSTAGKSISCPS